MRAAQYRGSGGREVLHVGDVPDPVPGTGDVLVEVAYAGLNRADVLERMGRYIADRPDVLVPGIEYSGIVRAVGAGVASGAGSGTIAPGARVCGLVSSGAHATLLVAHALTVSVVPDGITMRDAAAIPEAYITAADALFTQGRFADGETVLVHAAGSSVGLAAIALAARGGGVVIGTARTPAKLERAREHGLAHAIPLQEGWPQRVREATGGRGADVVLDFIGAAALEGNLAALAPRGRIVQIGTLGGATASISLSALMQKRATLVGTVLRTRPLDEKIALARMLTERILPRIARGELQATVDRVVPLERIADAHEAMESNANFGKIVIEVAGG